MSPARLPAEWEEMSSVHSALERKVKRRLRWLPRQRRRSRLLDLLG